MFRTELLVTVNRPPGWTRTEAPSAPDLFNRIEATSKTGRPASGAGVCACECVVACRPRTVARAAASVQVVFIVFMPEYNGRLAKWLTRVARDELGGGRLGPRGDRRGARDPGSGPAR